MLKFLSFFFPSIKKLIEVKKTQSKLLIAYEEKIKDIKEKKVSKTEYVVIDPINRGTAEAVQCAAALWTESNTLKYLIHSIKQELVEEIEEGGNAVEIQFQLIGIKRIVRVFEGYVKLNEQLQIHQSEGKA